MASLGPLRSPDDKKSSAIAKMAAMLRNARSDGQTPKRWIVTLDFEFTLIEEMGGIPDNWKYPGIQMEFMGLPIELDHRLIHDCILDVE
jgi:hypothetical protein